MVVERFLLILGQAHSPLLTNPSVYSTSHMSISHTS
jgi:hypothetical protein